MLEEHSMFTSKETPVEKCRLGDTVIDIPQELCEQKSLFKEVLSQETWNKVLRNEHRTHLMKFLPTFPEQDAVMKQKIMKDLFSDVNFKYGNPLDIFHKKLKDGFFSPDISKMATVLQRAKYQEYISQQQHYFYKLLQDILISRKRLLEACAQMPPDQPVRMERIHVRPRLSAIEHRTKRRYYRELQGMREEIGELVSSSEDENYPEGGVPKMNKRQKRQSLSLETSYTLEEGSVTSTLTPKYNVNGSTSVPPVRSVSPFEVSEESYRHLLLSYKMRRVKHKVHPEFDINSINLNDVGVRANISKRLTPKQGDQTGRKKGTKEKEKPEKRKSPPTSSVLNPSSNTMRNFDSSATSTSEIPLLKPKLEPVDSLDSHISSVPRDIDLHIGQNPSLSERMEEDFNVSLPRASSPILTQSAVSSFFALIRDFMSKGTESNFTIPKLEEKVKAWQDNPFSGLNDWCSSNVNWSEMVFSALEYLSGRASVTYPENFISFVDHKDNQESWRWAGEYRDSDEILKPLAAHWMEKKQEEPVHVTDDSESSSGALPPPRVVTDWAVRPMTEDEKSAYRNQEKRRYENPHMAYTIAMHGYESVVGPVKGVYGKDTSMNKAREHSLLVSDRPPFVTILSLVRDAAARLPNGEGTRADICELLKASQYLSPSTDAQIHTVVSGALDRLHYESDPCVKYDVNRKMWIYLHRNRSEEDYERIHQEQMAAAKAKKSVKPKAKQSKGKSAKAAAASSSSADTQLNASVEVTAVSSSSITSASVTTATSSKANSSSSKQTIHIKTSAKTTSAPPLSASLPVSISKASQDKSGLLTKEPSTSSASPKTTTARNSPLTGSEFISTILKKESLDTNHSSVEPVINSPFIITTSSSSLSNLSSNQVDTNPKPLISSSSLVNLTQVQIVGTTATSSSTNAVLTQAPKASTSATIAQLTVTQTPKTVGAIMAQQAAAAAAAAAVKNATASSQGTVKLVPSVIPHTTATLVASPISTAPIVTHKISQGALQGVPTIVFKQEGIQDPSLHSAMANSKPVVARIISPPQVVSVGNLIASTLAASQKHGKPIQGTTTIKIQGSNMIRSVSNKGSHINMVQATTAAASPQAVQSSIPRLTLVTQGAATNLLNTAGTTVAAQPKFVTTPSGQIGFVTSPLTTQQQGQVSSITKPTILTTQGGIKIVSTAASSNASLTQLGKANHTVVVSTKSQTPTSVTVTMGTTPAVSQNVVLASGIQSSSPAVVIASQRAIKPTQAVVAMATGPSTPTVVMATQQNLRPLAATTVTPMNMKTIHGVKVIPVTQAGAGAKGKPQPVFARIITPPTNLTLRPATMAATTTPPGIGVLHAVSQVTNRGLTASQTTSLNQVRSSVPSSVAQATIIRIQGPTVLPTGVQDQTTKDST